MCIRDRNHVCCWVKRPHAFRALCSPCSSTNCAKRCMSGRRFWALRTSLSNEGCWTGALSHSWRPPNRWMSSRLFLRDLFPRVPAFTRRRKSLGPSELFCWFSCDIFVAEDRMFVSVWLKSEWMKKERMERDLSLNVSAWTVSPFSKHYARFLASTSKKFKFFWNLKSQVGPFIDWLQETTENHFRGATTFATVFDVSNCIR